MLLTKKIKLDVSPQDAATLEFMQGKCRGLYNWWVMRLRDGERWNVAEAKKSLQESKVHDSELRQVYGKLLHEVYFRLDDAMKAFFRRVDAGEKPGFPRAPPGIASLRSSILPCTSRSRGTNSFCLQEAKGGRRSIPTS